MPYKNSSDWELSRHDRHDPRWLVLNLLWLRHITPSKAAEALTEIAKGKKPLLPNITIEDMEKEES
jgi:hypothetical protein